YVGFPTTFPGEFAAMPIERLAYLGFGVEDPKAWLKFAVEGLGLADAGASGGANRLRFDERAWRIALHPAKRNDLLYAGFEVTDAAALEKLESDLSGRGIECRRLTPAEVESRGVRGGVTFSDPDGLAIEVVYGHSLASEPVRSRLSFLTGEGGLGHLVLCVSDVDRSTAFYRSLGFEISDFIDMAVGPEQQITITFLDCNPRHHTLALAALPLPRRIEHFMLEVATVDEVIDTYNRLR